MNRYKELRKILEERRYFKVVCGAGNEDHEEVRLLSMIYTLAGALGIDVSANVQVVKASMDGIDRAFEIASKLNIRIPVRPFINVSVGLKGDPHVRKAQIDKIVCTQCGACVDVCEQKAIESVTLTVIKERCIGCGACEKKCPADAVVYETKKVDFQTVLPECLRAGSETLELHAIIADDQAVLKDWQVVSSALPDNFISMCLDRSQLSDEHLVNRIKRAKEIAGDRLIIQADGAPMSGGEDDCNTTLQAVAIADIVQKSRIPLMLLLSGGTNSKTGELAKLCNLNVHGISIGTFARKIIRREIETPDFDTNMEAIMKAYQIAKWLIDANLHCIRM